MRMHPSKARIARAVRGAVINAADAHPNWHLDPRLASSIAKRAAGTLTAEWPDVLAARLARRQERRSGVGSNPPSRRGASLQCGRRSPLKAVWQRLSRMVGEAKRAGEDCRAAALIDALRVVAKAQSRAAE